MLVAKALLILLGMLTGGYELLSSTARQRLDHWLEEHLSFASYRQAVVAYALAILLMVLFFRYAGYVLPVLFFLMLTMGPRLIYVSEVLSQVSRGQADAVAMPVGGCLFFVVMVVFYLLGWGFSLLLPESAPQVLFAPYEALSQWVQSWGLPLTGYLAPGYSGTEFRDNFLASNAWIHHLAFVEFMDLPWWLSLWIKIGGWSYLVYFKAAPALLCLSIIVIQAVYLLSVLLLLRMAMLTVMFPLFQAANQVHRKWRPDKKPLPLMGTIMAMIGGLLSLLQLLWSD